MKKREQAPTLEGCDLTSEAAIREAVTSAESLLQVSVIMLSLTSKKEGIVHFKDPRWDTDMEQTLTHFLNLCKCLGRVWDEKQVAIVPGRSEFVRSPEVSLHFFPLNVTQEVPYHTDSVKANIIGWLCVNPGDEETTTTRYLDIRTAYSVLSTREQELLSHAICRDPLQFKVAKDWVGPYEKVKQDENKFFWIPHRISIIYPDSANTAEKKQIDEAVHRFRKLLSGRFPAPLQYKVHLKAGDFVLVNNNVLLHGRKKISGISKRCLYRLYINTDGWDLGTNAEVNTPFETITEKIPNNVNFRRDNQRTCQDTTFSTTQQMPSSGEL